MTLRRILYVLKIFPKLSETFIVEELAELRRRGIEVRILSLQPPRAELRHDLVASAGLEALVCYEPKRFLEVVKGFRLQLLHAHFATPPTPPPMPLPRPSSCPPNREFPSLSPPTATTSIAKRRRTLGRALPPPAPWWLCP